MFSAENSQNSSFVNTLGANTPKVIKFTPTNTDRFVKLSQPTSGYHSNKHYNAVKA
jgi:hypothetical protein